MAFYDMLFSQRNIVTAQVLVTDEDFSSDGRRNSLRETLNRYRSTTSSFVIDRHVLLNSIAFTDYSLFESFQSSMRMM